MPFDRVVRDPIYGYIAIPAVLSPLVNHRFTQRLRRVGQTSLTSIVYPAATGSRFEHALGTMHLARRAWNAILANSTGDALTTFRTALNEEIERDTTALRRLREPDVLDRAVEHAMGAVGLLHDVGHPPFSHVLEPFYKRRAPDWLDAGQLRALGEVWGGQFHEAAGWILADQVLGYLPAETQRLARMIFTADPGDASAAGVLHSVIANEVDVDRLDYLMRDARKAGTEFGAIDWERLVDSLRLDRPGGEFVVAPTTRARSAVETMLVQRTQSYKWITFHHRVVGTNLALQRAVDAAWALAQDEGECALLGRRERVCDLLDGARPNLNYLNPGPGDVTRRLPAALRDGDADASGLLGELRGHVEAFVDDASVLQWLKDAAVICRVILHEHDGLATPTRERMERLVACVNVALNRGHQMVAAWKSLEEFALLAEQLMRDRGLGDWLIDACRAVEERCADGQRAAIAAIRLRLAGWIEGGDVVQATNWLLGTFQSKRAGVERVEQRLDAAHARVLDQDGDWALQYTGFKAVRTEQQLTHLYEPGVLSPLALADSSPIVRVLADAEIQRPRLYAYFILRDPGTPLPLTSTALQEAFVVTYDACVRELWPAHLESLAGLQRP